MKYSYRMIIGICIISMMLLSVAGCKKYLQIPAPSNAISSQNVYSLDNTAIEVLNGIYVKMQIQVNLSTYPSCSADDLTLLNNTSVPLNMTYANSLNSSAPNAAAAGNNDFWSPFYNLIYVANAAIEGLNQSTTLTPAVKQQLLGEAVFIRAWCYFYLVNLYGDLPLALTTDYTVNAKLTRLPAAQIYQQIITDLIEAQTRLSSEFLNVTLLNTTNERVRPTKWAAKALLSRAYLYAGNLTGDVSNYSKAAGQASEILQRSSSFSLVSLSNAFLINNNEAIWQLQSPPANSSNGGIDTQEAFFFITPSTGPSQFSPAVISPFLLSAFEPDDQRRVNWIGSLNVGGTTTHFAYKYKENAIDLLIKENVTVFRLAEQYLILAEADAEQGDLTNAATNLNKIRTRAGLPNTTASTRSEMLTAIQHERQVEFFTEFGHRWFDLKRTKTVNAVMSVVTPKKGGKSWDPNQALYPIPLAQIQAAPQLQQNAGY